ncbi:PqqD family protein [Nonomuraea sp. NPDC050663]|uniref:PqqD family protein n=1 Tax=Nonomuraea sp. NPDC050663 TaxID=3364370 RepID=UPI0017D62814|nr:PqqD family protein [Thermoactinospora sp.]
MSLRISESVIWQESAEGISLYHLESGDFRTLNESASRIWTLVASEGEREPIVERLAAEFSGGSIAISGQILLDVRHFLGAMIADGLIEEHPAA